MLRPPPMSTRTDPPFPHPTLFRSLAGAQQGAPSSSAAREASPSTTLRRHGHLRALEAASAGGRPAAPRNASGTWIGNESGKRGNHCRKKRKPIFFLGG